MDPNETLKQLLALAKRIQEADDRDEDLCPGEAAELADGVVALHSWMRSGGFLPDAWARREEDDRWTLTEAGKASLKGDRR